jgi:hypothetical protein
MEVPEPRTVTCMGAKGMIDQNGVLDSADPRGTHPEPAMDAFSLWPAWLAPPPLD